MQKRKKRPVLVCHAFVAACALGLAGCGGHSPETGTSDQPPAAAPKPAPEVLRMQLVSDDKTVALSDFRGKVLLVDFFASASDSCRAEIAPLNALYAELSVRPFAMLGITLDLKPQVYVESDLHFSQPDFPCALGGRNARDAFPGAQALPTKWLLDRNGVVVKRYNGPVPIADIRTDIEKCLAQ